jgi:hypothetical protein
LLLGALAAILSVVAAGCGEDDGGTRVLTLPLGQVTEASYRSYLHNLLRETDPGDTLGFCEFLDTMDDGPRVDSIPLPPDQTTPIAGATPSPEDLARAAELIREACDDLRDEFEG